MINPFRSIASFTQSTTQALDTLKTLFNMPYIGLPVNAQLSVAWAQAGLNKLTPLGLFRGLPIYASKCVETGRNNIGTQIVVKAERVGEKVTSAITDNIAPLPREYLIEGYIRGVSGVNTLGNLTGLTPIPVRAGLNDTASNIMLLKLFKQYLRYVRNSRTPFTFTSAEGEQMSALIEELEMRDLPEASNAIAVKLKVKEYITLRITDVGTDRFTSETGNLPTVGSIFNSPTQLMSVLSTQLLGMAVWSGELVTKVPSFLWWNDSTSEKSKTGASQTTGTITDTATDDAGNEIVEQDGFLITIYAPDTLGEITDSYGITASELYSLVCVHGFTDVSVASAPCATMKYTDEDGNPAYSEHFSISITFSGETVLFTFRRNQYDGKWFVDEDGSIGDTPLFHSHGVTLNSVQHLNDEFCYIMFSDYLPWGDDKSFEELTEQQQADCIANATFLFIR